MVREVICKLCFLLPAQVDVAETFARVMVTSVQPAGDVGVVVASDFLGSITVLRLITSSDGTALVPTTADR